MIGKPPNDLGGRSPAQIAGRNLLGAFNDPGLLAQMHNLAQQLRLDVQLHGFPLPGSGEGDD